MAALMPSDISPLPLSVSLALSLSVSHSIHGCLVDKLSSIYMVFVVAGCQTTDKSLFTLLNAI